MGLAVVAGILAMAGALAACSQSATAPPTVRSGFGSAGASAVSQGSGTGAGTADSGTTTADAGVTYCFTPTTGADAGMQCAVTIEVSGACLSGSTTGCPSTNLSGCCMNTPTGSTAPQGGTCFYGLSQTDTAAEDSACTAKGATYVWQTTLP